MKLYETGNANIWTDPHIQKQMLLAHLNVNTNAASRKPQIIEATVDWILSDFKEAGKLVDLGCGPGLYAQRFASRHWQVLGVDINSVSVEYAKQVAEANRLDIRYLNSSYLTPFTEEKFDLGTCIYCDFGALTPSQQKEFLGNVSNLINPGGMFVFDLFGAGLTKSKKAGKAWTREDGESFWSKEPCYVLSESVHFESEAVWGQKYIILPDGGTPKTYVLWDHYFTEAKIADLIGGFGWRIEEINLDLVKKNEFTSEDVLFIKARKI